MPIGPMRRLLDALEQGPEFEEALVAWVARERAIGVIAGPVVSGGGAPAANVEAGPVRAWSLPTGRRAAVRGRASVRILVRRAKASTDQDQ